MSSVIRDSCVDDKWSPKASTYDRFSAGLVASIFVSGFVVLSLLMIWLFGNDQVARGIPPLEPRSAIPIVPSGLEQELDEIVGGSNSPELVSLLESIENAVSHQAAQDGSPGKGDSLPGTPGIREPLPITALLNTARWKVSYEVENIDRYKRQLDFFGIEIGVVDKHETDIWRIGSLATRVTVTHSTRAQEELSTWFAHSKPTLRRWDRKISKESGIAVQDRLFIQFYPPELVATISKLEEEKLQSLGRKLDEVEQTNVAFSESGGHFLVSVTDFEFR